MEESWGKKWKGLPGSEDVEKKDPVVVYFYNSSCNSSFSLEMGYY